MIDFRKSNFVTSCLSITDRPKDNLPCIAILGRSNVGKSTLINALLGQKIAHISKKAGKTKLLNFFKIDNAFYLLDAPGYGSTIYANLSTINFAKMTEELIADKTVKGIIYLIDLRHKPSKDDAKFAKYLIDSSMPLLFIMTKADLLNQKMAHEASLYAGELGLTPIIKSDLSSKSIQEIRSAIAKLI